MTAEIILLSSIYDFASDLVALELTDRQIPFLRLNREQLAEYEISLDPAHPTLTVRHSTHTWHISSALRSVWFRQPIFLRNTPAEPLTTEVQLAQSQWMAFVRGLCVFRAARWVNNPQATYLAESKPYQLFLAQQLGFSVPYTLIGNDVDAIASAFTPPFVVKSLDTVLLREGEDSLFTYTTIQKPLDPPLAIRSAPVIAQRLFEPKTDIRVTVVGDTLFAARIVGKDRSIVGDWRVLPKEDLSYPDYKLDGGTAHRCRALVEQLGLSFGAIDLVEDECGVHFIEVNPTGEWAWLSNAERRIESAIVDHLTH